MKVTVNESTLINIADAIREKEGSGNVYYPSEMGEAIRNLPSGGGGNEPTDEELLLTGDCSFRFTRGGWDWFIEKYGDRITTQNVIGTANMFNTSKITNIPFDINYSTWTSVSLASMFYYCDSLETAPRLNNVRPKDCSYMFSNCPRLRELPEGFGNDFDWSDITNSTNTYNGSLAYMFYHCYSLRHIPSGLISHCNDYATYSYQVPYSGFGNCYALDELVDIAIPTGGTSGLNANIFVSTFDYCHRLKRVVFNTNEDGTAKVVKLKGQNISLSSYVGWTTDADKIISYNSGITSDKRVVDDETYQALKNDPDWFTTDMAYSRYNHDSAVETLNTLPDASAYLASSGGTNTIKFTGEAGSATDGGAINTLTEEEIAVATSKGWTVTLS